MVHSPVAVNELLWWPIGQSVDLKCPQAALCCSVTACKGWSMFNIASIQLQCPENFFVYCFWTPLPVNFQSIPRHLWWKLALPASYQPQTLIQIWSCWISLAQYGFKKLFEVWLPQKTSLKTTFLLLNINIYVVYIVCRGITAVSILVLHCVLDIIAAG